MPGIQLKPCDATSRSQDWLIDEDLKHFRTLMSSGDVQEARVYINELSKKWPDTMRVQNLKQKIAPPVVRVTSDETQHSSVQDIHWIKNHADRFPGQWLAIHCGELLANGASLNEVLNRVRDTPYESETVVHYQAEEKP